MSKAYAKIVVFRCGNTYRCELLSDVGRMEALDTWGTKRRVLTKARAWARRLRSITVEVADD